MNNEIVKLSIRITQDKYSCGKSLTVEVCAVQCSVVHVCVCVCVCVMSAAVTCRVVCCFSPSRCTTEITGLVKKGLYHTHTHTHTHTQSAWSIAVCTVSLLTADCSRCHDYNATVMCLLLSVVSVTAQSVSLCHHMDDHVHVRLWWHCQLQVLNWVVEANHATSAVLPPWYLSLYPPC